MVLSCHSNRMNWNFLNQSAHLAAPMLLGTHLITTIDGVKTVGRIVEVEAYTQKDPASHSYKGMSARNKAMFESAGNAYVYIIYGLHHCINVVTGSAGDGEAILIRAVEPVQGVEEMWMRRYGYAIPHNYRPAQLYNLSNGPGKLAKSFGITMALSNLDLLKTDSTVHLELPSHFEQLQIFNSRRIGISQGIETPWRWYLQSPWVSRLSALAMVV